jgi:hypothetical protein
LKIRGFMATDPDAPERILNAARRRATKKCTRSWRKF